MRVALPALLAVAFAGAIATPLAAQDHTRIDPEAAQRLQSWLDKVKAAGSYEMFVDVTDRAALESALPRGRPLDPKIYANARKRAEAAAWEWLTLGKRREPLPFPAPIRAAPPFEYACGRLLLPLDSATVQSAGLMGRDGQNWLWTSKIRVDYPAPETSPLLVMGGGASPRRLKSADLSMLLIERYSDGQVEPTRISITPDFGNGCGLSNLQFWADARPGL